MKDSLAFNTLFFKFLNWIISFIIIIIQKQIFCLDPLLFFEVPFFSLIMQFSHT